MTDLEPRLLRAFLAIYAASSVTQAAHAQRVSQPTMSEHLRRLREHFADRLFTRGPSGLVPTARAKEIRPVAEQIIAGLDALHASWQSWECESSNRCFRLIAGSYAQALILPELDKLIQQQAPDVRLQIRSSGSADELDSIDAAIWPSHAAPVQHRMRALFDDRLVCVFDRKLAGGSASLDLETFCSVQHVLLAPAPSPLHDKVDNALSLLGRKRRVCRIVSEIVSLPELLTGQRRLAIVPERLLQTGLPGLITSAIPLTVEPSHRHVLAGTAGQRPSAPMVAGADCRGHQTSDEPAISLTIERAQPEMQFRFC